MTMNTITNQTTEASLGNYFVHFFEVEADHFQMLAQKPRSDRDCEYLNRPYELSELMCQAVAAGSWPR